MYENFTQKSKKSIVAYMAIVSVMAYLVTFVIKIPIQFLSYDAKDVVITVGGLILGVYPTVAIGFVTALLEMLTISDSGIIGLAMNFTSTVFYCVPIIVIYNKTNKIILGIVLGTISATIAMFLFNIVITPIYLNVSLEDTMYLLMTLITPFNVAKGVLNGIFIKIIYQPIINALEKAGII